MKIETLYDIGDTVREINTQRMGRIRWISVYVDDAKPSILYEIEINNSAIGQVYEADLALVKPFLE